MRRLIANGCIWRLLTSQELINGNVFQDIFSLRTITFGCFLGAFGNCRDNAPVESFWATLNRECVDVVCAYYSQTRVELFGYIMGF
jgi:hypothetical protein